MKVMIDTNIFISAALLKALTPPYQPITCNYIIDELHRKFQEKFPHRMMELEAFLYTALSVIQVVLTPTELQDAEHKIRDPKDLPILRAALASGADLFLTGDKDFLESSVTEPRIISVASFLDL